jgi:uncharacterized membrane protein
MWFGAMVLWMVVFWVGVVVLALWVAGLLFPRMPAAPPQSTPRDILDARYARGELTRERYYELLKEFS